MQQTFRKRTGTTDKGKDYEVLNIADIVINLITEAKIDEFHISSNDEDFGAFDDIVVQTQVENSTETYAVQLKHSERGNLSLNQLAQARGDFSLKKYFASVQTMEVATAYFILFTNLKFNVAEGTIFYLCNEDFPITVTKLYPNNSFKISQTTQYCYKFSIVGDYEHCPKARPWKTFFEHFYLYPDQENVDSLKHSVIKKFKASFCGNDIECDQYLKFINEWSLQVGTKEKLNEKWMKLIIALKVLSSRIKPLSFNHNFEDSEIIKRNILREAIGAFDITIFGNESYGELKKLWNDAKCEVKDLKTVNNLRKKYQLSSTYISDIDQADPLDLSILFWLMGISPLILKQDKNIHKVLELCAGKNLILLKDDCVNSENTVFKILSDLTTKTSLYNELVKKFTCSLQGKEETCLSNLIKDNEEILAVLKTDDLLEMCQGRCRIGEVNENLPDPYVERCLLKNAIDFKILDNVAKDTIVILDCISQEEQTQNKLKRFTLVNINDYLNPKPDQPLLANISHTKFSTTTIYFNEKRCEYTQFQKICNKTENVKNFHQFRLRNDGNLEWIRSKGDVSDVEKYKLSNNYYHVQERDLGSSDFENNINLLVSDPGMGKSELMKSFKNKSFSQCFTVIIDPKLVYSFLKVTRDSNNYVDDFQKFLLDQNCRLLLERDKDIFRIFLDKHKIIYVWDALDELSDVHRGIVIDIIIKLSKNCLQWVTSRCHLQNMLQRKFNVLSLKLNKFDEEEQKNYILKRFENLRVEEEVKVIMGKIESSFVLVEHKDILGIPLHLFMLTELFRQNPEKYSSLSNNFFLLTDLYKYFIEEKINIHFREKLGIDSNTAKAEKLFQTQKKKILEEHTNAALQLLFPDSILTELAVQKTNFQDIHESHTNIGLVTDVKDQIPLFLHSCFAEYLAARYFANKRKHMKKILIQVMFDPRYINIRFFVDMLLAEGSPAHLAILYGDFGFIKNCNSDIFRKPDSGGRSVLHLACSRGERYPQLKVTYVEHTYIVDDVEIFNTTSDTKEYLEMMDSLLDKCTISEFDEICEMTPEEYARKATCLTAEMRLLMKQSTGKSIKNDHLINMLYYSVYYGYYQEFEYFFELFFQIGKKIVEQECTTTKRTLSRRVVDKIKNNARMTLLHTAAARGHLKIVEFLVKADADINLADVTGSIPLHKASWSRHDKIVELLVQKGGNMNHSNLAGFTPLDIASTKRYYKIAELFNIAGADLNFLNKIDMSPLDVAVHSGKYKIVEAFVKSGANINFKNEDGVTPLNRACFEGDDKVVEILVKAGAGINLAPENGLTPLYTASQGGKDKIVEFLIKAGADINLAAQNDFTPLNAASENGHYKVVELLVKAGANIHLANKSSISALLNASRNGYYKIIEFLANAVEDINLTDQDGSSLLHAASFNGYDKTVEILIKAGADVNIATKSGFTPVHAASGNGHYKIVKLLVKAGADINLVAIGGWSPLFFAALKGYREIVVFLVESGADINSLTTSGTTSLTAARINGHMEIVVFLISSGAVCQITFSRELIKMLGICK